MSETVSGLEKFQRWIDKNITSRMQVLTENPYLGGITDALMKIVPLTMVSSIVTIYDVIREYIPSLPSMGALSDCTFGISGLAIAYLIPYHIAERQGNRKKTYVGLAGLAMYFLALQGYWIDEGMVFNFDNFGAIGTLTAVVNGVFAAFVFDFCKKINIFKEDSGMPDFVLDWFDTLIPMFVSCLVIWILTAGVFHLDLFNIIGVVFSPLSYIITSIPGSTLYYMIVMFFYSCGISVWAFASISAAKSHCLPQNMAAYEAGARGLELPYHHVGMETFFQKGGQGNTLALNLLMLVSKSTRLKTLGRVYLLPSIMNINEPIIFGTMLWNPTLIIPSLITNVVNMILWVVFLNLGLCSPVHVVFGLWYLPQPVVAFVENGIFGVVLFCIGLLLDLIVYYPFFKSYERKVIAEDGE